VKLERIVIKTDICCIDFKVALKLLLDKYSSVEFMGFTSGYKVLKIDDVNYKVCHGFDGMTLKETNAKKFYMPTSECKTILCDRYREIIREGHNNDK